MIEDFEISNLKCLFVIILEYFFIKFLLSNNGYTYSFVKYLAFLGFEDAFVVGEQTASRWSHLQFMASFNWNLKKQITGRRLLLVACRIWHHSDLLIKIAINYAKLSRQPKTFISFVIDLHGYWDGRGHSVDRNGIDVNTIWRPGLYFIECQDYKRLFIARRNRLWKNV